MPKLLFLNRARVENFKADYKLKYLCPQMLAYLQSIGCPCLLTWSCRDRSAEN